MPIIEWTHSWIDKTKFRVQELGIPGLKLSLREMWEGLLGKPSRLIFKNRTDILSYDWDVLIVLDACRYELFPQMVKKSKINERIESIENISSPGSTSQEWLDHTLETLSSTEKRDYVYVTANPHSMTTDLNGIIVDEVWRYGWNEELESVPPQAVTDRAIANHRKYPNKRLIIHYMQPHFPFIGSDIELDVSGFDPDDWLVEDPKSRMLPNGHVWDELKAGRGEIEQVIQAYQDNLEFVLDSLDILLENIDGNTIITSDHGNAFGEWGIFGHPYGVRIPELINVPWIQVETEDKRNYNPEIDPTEFETDVDVEERLRSLGYK